jgi:hypothetical protein
MAIGICPDVALVAQAHVFRAQFLHQRQLLAVNSQLGKVERHTDMRKARDIRYVEPKHSARKIPTVSPPASTPAMLTIANVSMISTPALHPVRS